MITISVINQKGGVSKTTTAHALGTGLALTGERVLLIDLDMQRSLSAITGALPGPTILDVLSGNNTTREAIQALQGAPGVDIIQGDRGLAGIDMILNRTGKEYKLREKLEEIRARYDYCIIDCPPTLNILTINALTASHSALITATADYLTLNGIDQLKDTLEAVRSYTNRGLKIAGVLITKYNGRAVISREAKVMIEKQAELNLHTKVFNTTIRSCIAIQEAQALHQSIFKYAPRSNGAKDYTAFINELKEVL